MTITIPFTELQEYVTCHYAKRIELSKVSDKEIRVGVFQRILFKSMKVNVDIRIDNVYAESVEISYKSALGVDLMIGGMMVFLKTKFPEIGEAIVTEPGNKIKIALGKLEKTKALVDNMVILNIIVNENSITIETHLK